MLVGIIEALDVCVLVNTKVGVGVVVGVVVGVDVGVGVANPPIDTMIPPRPVEGVVVDV
jgi:hypothetical protein